MMDEERDLELIDGFISGELSEIQVNQLRLRLEQEPDLRLLKDDLEGLRSGVEAVGREHFKEKMADWDKDFENPLIVQQRNETKIIPWRNYISWAAMLVLGFFSVFFWYTSDGQKASRLYGKHFEVYDNVIVPTQRGGDNENLEEEAFGQYDLREYAEAKVLFDQLVKENDADYVLFYQGMVLMALEDWANAEDVLVKVGNDFKLQANWYRALNALRQQNFEKAKELLIVLESGGSSYSNTASALLRKLD